MLEVRELDEIFFANYKFLASNVLKADLKYKMCVRFDGGLELVHSEKDYWIPDPRFNWRLEQKFNVLSPNTEYDDPIIDKMSFFVGNMDRLKKTQPNCCSYTFIPIDYIEGIWKPPIKSTEILEKITDKFSNERIGYCIRRGYGEKNVCIQSFHPIDVHYHSDEGWYNQAVLFDGQNKNRLIFMGAQNNDVGVLAIPELYFDENNEHLNERHVDFHEKDYVKEFLQHNLSYCDEAEKFYIPENATYACKQCMKIAQDFLKKNEN